MTTCPKAAFATELPTALEAESEQDSEGVQVSRLLKHMPIALWEVDATRPAEVFERLKADGIDDLETYLLQNPDLVESSCDTVVVTLANDAALRLMGQTDPNFYPRSVRSAVV